MVGCAQAVIAMNPRGRVTRSEWRWLAAWIAVAMLVTSVPYAIGLARSSPDRIFGGSVFAVEDVNSYLAKMREGASGEWLFHIVYTSEPHEGALLFLFHLLLGKLAVLIGLPLEVMYHAARIVLGAFLLVVTYRFTAMITGSIAIRRIAFLLVTFGGGLGWALMAAGQPNWLGSPPLDLISPEGFTFLVLYAMPHIALARSLMLLGLIWLWTPSARRDWQVGLAVGGSWAGMALIVPFYVVVTYAIVFGALCASSLVRRRIAWDLTRRAMVACATCAIFPLYTLAVLAANPVFSEWSRQNQIVSPHPAHYLLAYGVGGGLALASLRWAWRRNATWHYLIGWLIVIPLLVYAPLGIQRRLIEGWQLPLSLLAAATLVRRVLPAVRRSHPARWLARFPRYTTAGVQRWALCGLLLLMIPTYGLLLFDQALRAATGQPPMFRDGGEIAALDWLSTRATYQDVVLAAYPTGNYLPARVPARSFVGHGPETIHLEAKRSLVAQFYSTSTSDAWRETFLRQWAITFVFVGPAERDLGQADLSSTPYLEVWYSARGYQIYRVSEDSVSTDALYCRMSE